LSNKKVETIFQGPEKDYLDWAEDTIKNA
jgi:hypothetical protein